CASRATTRSARLQSRARRLVMSVLHRVRPARLADEEPGDELRETATVQALGQQLFESVTFHPQVQLRALQCLLDERPLIDLRLPADAGTGAATDSDRASAPSAVCVQSAARGY